MLTIEYDLISKRILFLNFKGFSKKNYYFCHMVRIGLA